MAGIISKGIKLSYKTSASSSTYTEIANLQEIPDLGNAAGENIETTVLSDECKTYIAGLADYSSGIDFKFLYVKGAFNTLTSYAIGETNEASLSWKVELPDTSTITFDGKFNYKINSVGTNNALNMTLTIIPDGKFTMALASA